MQRAGESGATAAAVIILKESLWGLITIINFISSQSQPSPSSSSTFAAAAHTLLASSDNYCQLSIYNLSSLSFALIARRMIGRWFMWGSTVLTDWLTDWLTWTSLGKTAVKVLMQVLVVLAGKGGQLQCGCAVTVVSQLFSGINSASQMAKQQKTAAVQWS